MEQNSTEWYKLRNYKLGASDANIIMGTSRFSTPLKLWEQKTGRNQEKSETNFIQQKGHDLEEKFRNIVEIEYMTDFPATVFVSENIEFLMASLDGYSSELNLNWECKVVGKEKFENIELVKKEYYPQIQQQLLLTSAKYCVLTCLWENNGTVEKKDLKVYPDDDYINNELLPSLINFWKHVQDDTKPDLSTLDVVDYSDNAELCGKLEEYRATKLLIEEYAKKEKELKKQIYAITKVKKASCQGFKISWSKSEDKKVFDYVKFEKENEISENYLKVKKGAKNERITIPD